MISGRMAGAAFFAALLNSMGQAQAPATSSSATVAARPAKIPTEIFAQPELLRSPLISPVGDRFVTRLNRGGKEYLGIYSVAAGLLKAMAAPDKAEISWYRWAGNDRLLVSISSTVDYFGEDAQMTRLMAYDVGTGASRFIGDRKEGLEGDDVLYVDPEGAWILLSIQRSIIEYPSVLRVDLATNKMKSVVRDQMEVWEWFADDKGVVRVGLGFDERSWFMVYRKGEDEKFRRVGRARYDDEQATLDLLHLAADSDEGYMLSNEKTGRYAVHKYNFATRELGEVVYESPTNDISDFSLTEDGKGMKAAWFTDDRDRVVWFDPGMKKHQEDIDAALKGRMNWIISRSRDDKKMLVWTGASNDPGSYYFYTPDEGMMTRIAKVNERIDRKALAPTTYVKYRARDDLEIPAYLTLPLGRDLKGLPLIVLPHGGPYGVRDRLDYDPEVQFLANRGYAVLQPNFRGSSSYGKTFYEKGEGQWGRQMQDDLDDGMDWLVKQGIVDPKRVCIVGSSYGGYAALWGATRNPERYRCAASWAGVTDVRRQLSYSNRFFIDRRYRKDWRKRVQGQKDFDLDSISPLRQVAKLQVPVLLAHGEDDQTVPYKQSASYADVLKKAGKSYEFHSYKDEGHSFSSPENLRGWLDRLEAFLSKHNPAE
jgi:dipeptidyl aminopeptidase/acylaminoacyl peptidase